MRWWLECGGIGIISSWSRPESFMGVLGGLGPIKRVQHLTKRMKRSRGLSTLRIQTCFHYTFAPCGTSPLLSASFSIKTNVVKANAAECAVTGSRLRQTPPSRIYCLWFPPPGTSPSHRLFSLSTVLIWSSLATSLLPRAAWWNRRKPGPCRLWPSTATARKTLPRCNGDLHFADSAAKSCKA